MGKKGVLLDNGKVAQSSMALYWKQGRQKQKLPKEKIQKPVDQEKQIDDRAENGYDKWKLHKEKLITKAYTLKTKQKTVDQKEREKEQQKIKDQEEQFEKEMLEKQMNKNKPISIPGFKNRNHLQKALLFQNIQKQVDQSKNKLILPPQMGQMTEQEIIQLLRERKAKKEIENTFQKKVKQNLHQKVVNQDKIHKNLPEDFNILLGDQRKDEEEEQKKRQLEEKQKERLRLEAIANAPFFKSDVLNKLEKGEESLIKKFEDKKNEEKMRVFEAEIKKLQAISIETNKTQEILSQSKFIPRALKK